MFDRAFAMCYAYDKTKKHNFKKFSYVKYVKATVKFIIIKLVQLKIYLNIYLNGINEKKLMC